MAEVNTALQAAIQQIRAINPSFTAANILDFYRQIGHQLAVDIRAHFLSGLLDPAVQASEHFTFSATGPYSSVRIQIPPEGAVLVRVSGIEYLPNGFPISDDRKARFYSLLYTRGREWLTQTLEQHHIDSSNQDIQPFSTGYPYIYHYTAADIDNKGAFQFMQQPTFVLIHLIRQTVEHFQALNITQNNNTV